MADIGEAIYARLNGDATLTGLLNGGIYGGTPSVTPQRPYIVYQLINLVERPHAMGSDPSLVIDRYQVDIYADTRTDRIDVDDRVQVLLSRWRGSAAGVTIDSSFQGDHRDIYESETELFRRSTDYIIAWMET